MNSGTEIIMNFFIHSEALNAASSGNATGIIIAVVYVLLLIASVIGVAVVIERAIRLRRGRIIDPNLAKSVPEQIRGGNLDSAISLAQGNKTYVGDALAVELDEHRQGHVPIEEAMQTADGMVEEKMNANLDILASVAKVAPLLGLLGTVLGMMYAFGQLDIGTRKDTLAHGITAALDTTVRGLVIAIFCLTFEGVFVRRIDRAAKQIEAFFIDIIRGSRRQSQGKHA
jgi:biopolymer transport protein ExbB